MSPTFEQIAAALHAVGRSLQGTDIVVSGSDAVDPPTTFLRLESGKHLMEVTVWSWGAIEVAIGDLRDGGDVGYESTSFKDPSYNAILARTLLPFGISWGRFCVAETSGGPASSRTNLKTVVLAPLDAPSLELATTLKLEFDWLNSVSDILVMLRGHRPVNVIEHVRPEHVAQFTGKLDALGLKYSVLDEP